MRGAVILDAEGDLNMLLVTQDLYSEYCTMHKTYVLSQWIICAEENVSKNMPELRTSAVAFPYGGV